MWMSEQRTTVLHHASVASLVVMYFTKGTPHVLSAWPLHSIDIHFLRHMSMKKNQRMNRVRDAYSRSSLAGVICFPSSPLTGTEAFNSSTSLELSDKC